MSEKKQARLVSEKEIESIQKDNLRSGVFYVVLGYLESLRESTADSGALREIHEKALSSLMPGNDFDGYKLIQGQAYEYLVKNAEKFHIKIDNGS